jgi:hypothetical protein
MTMTNTIKVGNNSFEAKGLTAQQRAKVGSVLHAHHAWQRGEINEQEYLRRADILDEQHAAIEQGMFRSSATGEVLVRICNVLYPR